ncbi:MAG TPA: hypothetical protein H9671_12090 [Firmicutes bacterium]|nr:hypothetical protein [Bacillota bacterium]
MKKFLSIGLILAMVLSLTSCGSISAVEIMKNAQDQTAAIENFEAEIVTSIAMNIGGMETAIKTTTNTVAFTDPMKMKIFISEGTQNMEIVIVQEGDAYYAYGNLGGEWVKEKLPADALVQYDAQQNMAFYLDLVDELTFSPVTEEKLNGQAVYHFDAEASAETIQKIFQATGMDDQLAALGDLSGMMEDLFSNLNGLKMSMWYDKATGYPLQYEMDMTEIYNQMIQNLMDQMDASTGDLGFNVTELKLTMTYSNYNSAEDFELPVIAE